MPFQGLTGWFIVTMRFFVGSEVPLAHTDIGVKKLWLRWKWIVSSITGQFQLRAFDWQFLVRWGFHIWRFVVDLDCIVNDIQLGDVGPNLSLLDRLTFLVTALERDKWTLRTLLALFILFGKVSWPLVPSWLYVLGHDLALRGKWFGDGRIRGRRLGGGQRKERERGRNGLSLILISFLCPFRQWKGVPISMQSYVTVSRPSNKEADFRERARKEKSIHNDWHRTMTGSHVTWNNPHSTEWRKDK